MQRFAILWLLGCLLVTFEFAAPADGKEVKPLSIGAEAPELNLPGVDDKTYQLKDFADANVLVVIFTCNHCPTAQAYEQRILKLHTDYADRGVAFVAVSPNDPLAVRLDELGYSDLGDSLDDMKVRAKRLKLKFPYLYDGEKQCVSSAYGVLATPHVFIFDQQRKLRYNGRIDDGEVTPPKSRDARNAIDALLAGEPVPVETTRVFGCSTKWADKRVSAVEAVKRWDAEPVTLAKISEGELKKLAANETENYRLVNLWSTTCAPCIDEFSTLVTVNRMYRGRHFEMITLSIDPPGQLEAAQKLLEKHYVSSANYIFESADRDALAEALDPEWQGPVPYTILIAPGGKIVERWKDELDPLQLKTKIVEYLGRTYASKK